MTARRTGRHIGQSLDPYRRTSQRTGEFNIADAWGRKAPQTSHKEPLRSPGGTEDAPCCDQGRAELTVESVKPYSWPFAAHFLICGLLGSNQEATAFGGPTKENQTPHSR